MRFGSQVTCVWLHVRVSETLNVCVTQRIDTDLNTGPTPYTMPSRFFNDDYPRKEIKALSTIKLKSLRKGPGAGIQLILDDLCWWSMMKMSVLCSKKKRAEWMITHFCLGVKHIMLCECGCASAGWQTNRQSYACLFTSVSCYRIQPPDFGVWKLIETEIKSFF